VFLIGALDVGGTERQLVDLAARLDRARFDPVIYCLSAFGPLAEEARRHGIDVQSAGLRGLRPWKHPARLARRVLKMFQDLRALEPDILHAFLFHAYTTGAFLSPFVRARAFVSSRRSLGHFKANRPAALIVERLANQFADIIVANSEAVRQDAISQERLPPERVIVIHNGVDVARFPASPTDGVRQQIDAAPGATVVAMVANFIAYKGHHSFLSAWRSVLAAHPNAVAVLVGDGPLREQIEKLGEQLDVAESLRFLGNRSDVPQLLSGVDLVVHPSEQEGFCNAILEAMAAGRAVIATRVGGNVEAVVDGETGLLVPPNDPDALAAAIQLMLARPDLRTEFGRAGRRRVSSSLGIERMTGAYELLYRDLVARAAPRNSPVAVVGS